METGILLALQSLRVVGLTQLMALVYALGGAAFIWIALAVVMLFIAESRQMGVLVIVSVIIAAVLCALVIAPIVGRPRPCDAGIGVTAVVGVAKAGFGFPCTRVATSFAAATAIALSRGKKFGFPAVVGAVAIAFSCLFVGVSYPTDALAGMLVGIAVGVVVVWVYNTFFRGRLIESTGGSRRGRTSVKRRG